MVKTPSVRHSKSRNDPVTIDIEASRVPSGTSDASPTPSSANPAGGSSSAGAAPIVEGKGFTMAEPDAPAGPPKDGTSSMSMETSASGAAQPASVSGDDRAATAAPRDRAGTPSQKAAPKPSTDAPDQSSPTPPKRDEPRRGGFSTVAAGVIGGIIALAGGGALQYAGILPSPGANTSASASLDGLRGEIAGLQADIATLKAGAGDASGGQEVADLQARLQTLADDLGALKSAVESGGAGENAGLAALDAKIAELQTQISRISQAPGAEPVDLAPLDGKIAALEADLRTAIDKAGATDERLATLEEAVSSLSGKVDAQADQPKIALSIAASALKSAIERGQPFSAELETLAAISPNLPQLAELRAHAEAGVPARDALVAGMDEAANAMIAADRPVDPDAGYLDQLLESASSLVTVRPVGEAQGEGVPETVARMEAALKAGELEKALAEYETLPEAPKAAGGAFAGKIRARLDVETLVDRAIAEAMKTV